MSKIKNLIFDFDGTIIDSKDLMIQIAVDVAPQVNVKISEFDIADIEKYREMSPSQLIKLFNIKYRYIPKVIKLFFTMYDIKIYDVPLIKDMKDIISKIKDKNKFIGILSTNSYENIYKIMERENITYIDDIMSLRGAFFMKNIMILNFLQKNKLKKDETIYIGDEVRDMQAAKKAGVITGAVTWGLNTKEALKKYKPDYIFDSPSDILNVI